MSEPVICPGCGSSGISTRLYIATQIAAGMWASPNLHPLVRFDIIANDALGAADALIKLEAETRENEIDEKK